MTLLEMVKKYEEISVALNVEYKNQTMGNRPIEIVDEILEDLKSALDETSLGDLYTIIQKKMAVVLEKGDLSEATMLAEILAMLPRG